MRLAATANPISDQLAQDVLKRGLHEIFEPWSIQADGVKYASFRDMEMALKRYATRPLVAAKLQALMPTDSRTASVMVTSAGDLTPKSKLILALRSKVKELGKGQNESRPSRTSLNQTRGRRPSETISVSPLKRCMPQG